MIICFIFLFISCLFICRLEDQTSAWLAHPPVKFSFISLINISNNTKRKHNQLITHEPFVNPVDSFDQVTNPNQTIYHETNLMIINFHFEIPVISTTLETPWSRVSFCWIYYYFNKSAMIPIQYSSVETIGNKIPLKNTSK